jgi:hypothetical protein
MIAASGVQQKLNDLVKRPPGHVGARLVLDYTFQRTPLALGRLRSKRR